MNKTANDACIWFGLFIQPQLNLIPPWFDSIIIDKLVVDLHAECVQTNIDDLKCLLQSEVVVRNLRRTRERNCVFITDEDTLFDKSLRETLVDFQ